MRAAILDACREFMRAGRFRPSAVEIARMAGCATRTVFMHFTTVEALYLEAIADRETSNAIFWAARDNVARAVVLGRSG